MENIISTPMKAHSLWGSRISNLTSAHDHLRWLLLDFALVFTLSLLGIWLSPFGTWLEFKPQELIFCLSYASAFCFLILGFNLYNRFKRFYFKHLLNYGTLSFSIALVFALALNYFIFYEGIGRQTIAYAAIGSVVGFYAVRLAALSVLRSFPYRFTIVGDSKIKQEIIDFFHTNGSNHHFTYIPWEDLEHKNIETLIENLNENKISDLVFTKDGLTDPKMLNLAMLVLQRGGRIVDEFELYIDLFERLPIQELPSSWVFREGLNNQNFLGAFFKRSFDIVFATIGIICALPLLAVFLIILKLSSPGPLFYVQKRMGKYFKPFSMYKIRTMHTNHNQKGFTQKKDPRVNFLGRMIRSLHLDEVPQFFNILRGDMSVVGPRPEADYFAQAMGKEIDLYCLRYTMKPGLTGLAQIKLGYILDNTEGTIKKLSYDLYYLCRYSILKDMIIIIQTVFNLKHGAQ